MTQEELDALMSGGLDDADTEEIAQEGPKEEVAVMEESSEEKGNNFRVKAEGNWPPPPPTADHKMVQQLDDVTKDSEEKATQMFDKLDMINSLLIDAEELCNSGKGCISSNVEIFEKLCAKFPNVETFKGGLEKNRDLSSEFDNILDKIQGGENEIMSIMDMMQYQDIHRQKIERVINVMRALSRYMNSLFESSVDDKNRVSSAVHIQGDTQTESVMSDDDIEALIATLGKK